MPRTQVGNYRVVCRLASSTFKHDRIARAEVVFRKRRPGEGIPVGLGSPEGTDKEATSLVEMLKGTIHSLGCDQQTA